jgi:hypothetical protein
MKLPFSKFNIQKIFAEDREIDSLLNVKDKQNVPLAVKLMKKLNEVNPNNFHDGIHKDILNEIKIFNMLMSWFMTICFKPDVNLLDQLISLASLSYSCLIIYRKFKGKFYFACKFCQ